MEKFIPKKESPNEVIKIIQEKIKEIYNQEKPINSKQILEIKENLEKIPNLVINFDETMTATDTIRKIVDKLKGVIPEKSEELQTKWEEFTKMALEYREAKKEGKEYKTNLIKYFYTNIINGTNLKDLDQAYDQIIAETELNPNLEKVFNHLKKEQKTNQINLFALSLNTDRIIQKFYEKNKEFFQKHNVKIIGIVGNQIKTDENGNIVDIDEHVTDQNKKDYIPPQSIMLADDRETESLIEKGVNVINVQGEKFHDGILSASLKLREFIVITSEIKPRNKKEREDIESLINILTFRVKKIKLEHEKDRPIDNLISQYLTFYDDSRKLLLELIKKEV